jgi:hypothetical protein
MEKGILYCPETEPESPDGTRKKRFIRAFYWSVKANHTL